MKTRWLTTLLLIAACGGTEEPPTFEEFKSLVSHEAEGDVSDDLFIIRSGSMIVVQRWWSPVLLWAGGAKLTVKGLEHLDPKQPYIFVSNHQSTIDIPTLFRALPWDVRFVAKSMHSHLGERFELRVVDSSNAVQAKAIYDDVAKPDFTI